MRFLLVFILVIFIHQLGAETLNLARVTLRDGRVLEGLVEDGKRAKYKSIRLFHKGKEQGAMEVYGRDIVKTEAFIFEKPGPFEETEAEKAAVREVGAEDLSRVEMRLHDLYAEKAALQERMEGVNGEISEILAHIAAENKRRMTEWICRLRSHHLTPVTDKQIFKLTNKQDIAWAIKHKDDLNYYLRDLSGQKRRCDPKYSAPKSRTLTTPAAYRRSRKIAHSEQGKRILVMLKGLKMPEMLRDRF